MKYVESKVTFSEVPDEISLCLTISGCKSHCEGCHSEYLQQDIGTELTEEILKDLIYLHKGITCVCFLGGNPYDICKFSKIIKNNNLKLAYYTGDSYMPTLSQLSNFDYIKLGPYLETKGGLNNPNTNQRMFKIEDITHKFWK